jgi:hypothetical protein
MGEMRRVRRGIGIGAGETGRRDETDEAGSREIGG